MTYHLAIAGMEVDSQLVEELVFAKSSCQRFSYDAQAGFHIVPHDNAAHNSLVALQCAGVVAGVQNQAGNATAWSLTKAGALALSYGTGLHQRTNCAIRMMDCKPPELRTNYELLMDLFDDGFEWSKLPPKKRRNKHTCGVDKMLHSSGVEPYKHYLLCLVVSRVCSIKFISLIYHECQSFGIFTRNWLTKAWLLLSTDAWAATTNISGSGIPVKLMS